MPYLEKDLPTIDVNNTGNSAGYVTAEDKGADYSLWGKFTNLFSGKNTAAENIANSYNTAQAEKREREYNAEEAAKARAFNAAEAETARQFSANEAEKTRQWEKLMSDTKYQRMMKDAKKAGINPLYLIGATSSSPSSPTAQTSTASGGGASYNSKTPKLSDAKSILGTITALTAVMLKSIVSK